MSDEGRLVANRYRIIERIGTGAMGAVWKAQDEVLHRDVAIKQLLLQPGLDENEAEDARQRTMREARLAARLHHPNAISVFDVVTDEHGQPCLIMEYLPSTSLAAVLQQNTLDPLEVARIGAQIASALTDAHQVGVVHRDIKPGNVLLAENGTVKLTDFGISRATDDVTVTKTGMIAGTPAYLAPEVAVGGDPGPESDVFALGSTLYAATEGQPPFGLSENTLSLLHAVAAGQINPPRQSGPLASVLAVMLHPETQHRPTADESEDLLAAVARGETPLGGPTDETMMAASIGAAGAAAGAGAVAAASAEAGPTGYLAEQADLDGFDRHYSGTLSGDVGAGAGATVDEGPFQPGDGYPVEDYDATRAVPTGVIGHGDYGAYEGTYEGVYPGVYEGYEYDDDYDDGVPPAVPMEDADEDDDERGNWKIPAAIGAVTLLGLIVLAIWIFSPPSGEGEADQPPVPAQSDTTTSSSSRETTTTTTTTTTSTTTFEPAPNPNPNPGGDVDQPQPTQDDPPPQQTTRPETTEPPTESSTTTTTTTTSSPPISSSSQTTTPTPPDGPADGT